MYIIHTNLVLCYQICMKEFAVLIGQMRKRFGHENSPLCTCVLTVWGSRNICATALKTLREWGLEADEVYCLAGAPCSPILAVVKPHILWDGGLHNMRDSSAPSWESVALGWTHKCCFPFLFILIRCQFCSLAVTLDFAFPIQQGYVVK